MKVIGGVGAALGVGAVGVGGLIGLGGLAIVTNPFDLDYNADDLLDQMADGMNEGI